MRFLKYLLSPIQIIYSLIIIMRNQLYDLKILSSYNAEPITISVGNIKNGGTGKTPMVEYLIRLFQNKKISVLSRGYKRQTNKFILANKRHTAKDIGDENYQLYNKFENIIIAADNNRVHGIKKITQNNQLDVVILDDGFQHRSLHRDIDILLTEHNNLFIDDELMPIGNLREHKKEMKRANIIIITKCPKDISKEQRYSIIDKIKPSIHQKVYFSHIKEYTYINMSSLKEIALNKDEKHILITAIANAKPLVKFLNDTNISHHHISFSDHYNFKRHDITKMINLKQNNHLSKNLLLTEKDYYRLSLIDKKRLEEQFILVCVQIKIDFMEGDKSNFNKQLLKFEKPKT